MPMPFDIFLGGTFGGLVKINGNVDIRRREFLILFGFNFQQS